MMLCTSLLVSLVCATAFRALGILDTQKVLARQWNLGGASCSTVFLHVYPHITDLHRMTCGMTSCRCFRETPRRFQPFIVRPPMFRVTMLPLLHNVFLGCLTPCASCRLSLGLFVNRCGGLRPPTLPVLARSAEVYILMLKLILHSVLPVIRWWLLCTCRSHRGCVRKD